KKATATLGISRVGADAVESLQRELGRNLGVLGDERLVARVDGCQLASHSFEVFEANPIADALVLDPFPAESVGPEVEGVRRGDAPRDRVDHSRAGRPPRRVRILEERNVAAGAAFLVRVEEVVNGRVDLIHRLLDEPQSENTRVEVDVARGVAGDQRDVVNALEAHARSITSGGLSTRKCAAEYPERPCTPPPGRNR